MDDLPDEIIALVLASLPCAIVRGAALLVCRRWQRIALDTSAIGRRSCLDPTAGSCKASQCVDAARHGHLDCLAYARSRGRRWNRETCRRAAEGGHLACLAYARRHGCPWDQSACENAAAGGHIHVLKWLHANGCSWSSRTCDAVAYAGHLDCLRYLHEHGCPWDYWTCAYAAAQGHLDCLTYAHANGCALVEVAGKWAATGGHLDCMIFLADKGVLAADTCTHAASSGNVACLAWAHERGFAWDALTCAAAAERGSLECLVYARDRDCPWDSATLTKGVRRGHADIVCYAIRHGCPRDDAACLDDAVWCGNVDVLRLLLDAGVRLTIEAVCLAARHGRQAILAEAHRRGFADHQGDVCYAAAVGGQLDNLKWAHECGWAWGGMRTCQAAIDRDTIELTEYVERHGCHCDAWQRRFAPTRRRRLVARNAPGRKR
ncbi:Ankyrin repeat domain containing protein [Pandoravirus salinus]|uniref:Ankyrin repeat domain containing protein n=1 Tax=Pandoravirus salinus TaxID=1349410 RepID=S4VW50_9VIRU|nr:ankyrin repeat domain [Pandoravirus salinus]AGO83656.1 Ankyrin repeat domain containing protein [Pandoravirus salinus]